jgi:hypothetical protein
MERKSWYTALLAAIVLTMALPMLTAPAVRLGILFVLLLVMVHGCRIVAARFDKGMRAGKGSARAAHPMYDADADLPIAG